MAQLTCRDLTLGYEGRVVANEIEFSVHKGDYLFILGENGSGKTTLAKAILQLNKPISGQILFGDGLKRNQIGYLPQQTPAQRDFPASVKEIVLSGGLNRGGLFPFYSKGEKVRARELMKKLEILPLADQCYRELSGGQQQRVLLARALMATGSLLLLDEPTAGLDPHATDELYRLIDRINKEGITVVMISHDLAAAEKYAGAVLHVGKKTEFFPTFTAYEGRNKQ